LRYALWRGLKAHGRQAMGRRYDLALMILGRRAPQLPATI
jgi:hypothetical protein